MKIFALASLMFLASVTLSSECPVNDQVGNTINFLRLFREKADSDWDYQNLNTNFKLRLHQVDTTGQFATHRIVFEISENQVNGRTWFYMIQALFDETDVLQKIERFARLRKYQNNDNQQFADKINQLLVDQFFLNTIRAYNPNNYQGVYKLNDSKTTQCSPLTKMEYSYFYYLATNYYKDGAKQGWGLREPVLAA